MTERQIRVEYMPLGQLLRRERNPKRHRLDELEGSFRRFGYTLPPMLDERDGKLVAGHGRIDGLYARKQAGKAPPDGIHDRGDDWYIPVLRGIRFRNEKEALAYLLADNRLTEIGGYDEGVLAELVRDVALTSEGLEGTGWTEEEIEQRMRAEADRVLGGGEGEIGDVDDDSDDEPAEEVDDGPKVNPTDELRKKWGTEQGQLWEIVSADGKRMHRLAVGDSTDPKRIATLMNGCVARLLKSDPPYGVDYSKAKDGIPRKGFENHTELWGDIKDDDLDDAGLLDLLRRLWAASLPHLTDDCAVYIWHPPGARCVAFVQFFQAEKLVLHRSIVWVKAGFVLTRSGMYHWSHEPCLYGWRKGHMPPWYGPKNQRSAWTAGRDDDSGMHPTQKPAELWAIAMRNHLKPGEAALDFCAGSGPCFVAAEALGCVAHGCELEPKYAAVILERMSARGCTPRLAA